MYRFTIVVCLTVLVFLTGISLADIPKLLNCQGVLTDSSRDPSSGTQSATFKIYRAESDGPTIRVPGSVPTGDDSNRLPGRTAAPR